MFMKMYLITGEKFREMGLEPEDIQTLNDVIKLPLQKNRRFVISIHSVYLPFLWRINTHSWFIWNERKAYNCRVYEK